MKIKCNESVAIAWDGEPSKSHVHLFKDQIIDIDEKMAMTAINLGFASKCDECGQKMFDEDYKNKMMTNEYENKEIRQRGRPRKDISK